MIILRLRRVTHDISNTRDHYTSSATITNHEPTKPFDRLMLIMSLPQHTHANATDNTSAHNRATGMTAKTNIDMGNAVNNPRTVTRHTTKTKLIDHTKT